MDKNDLSHAAWELGMEELSVRMACDRAFRQKGSVPKALVKDGRSRVLKAKQYADHIRSRIPEIRDKVYWWDIPFDPEQPVTEFPDTFSMINGVCSEQDDIAFENGRMFQKSLTMPGGTAMNTYLSGTLSTVVYLDKKEMKKHLADPVRIRKIICAEMNGGTRPSPRKQYRGVIPGSWEYRQWVDNLKSLQQELPEKLSSYSDKNDMIERFVHNSYYTNKERFLFGAMEAEDYYREDLWRTLGEQDIIRKNREEQERYRHLAAAARRDYASFVMQQALDREGREAILNFMECGAVIYYKEQLLAITIYTSVKSVYEIKLKEPCSLLLLDAEMKYGNELMVRRPDPLPVIDFVIEEYSSSMKPYKVLNARPKGASDQFWRVWAERRLAYSVLPKVDDQKM